MNLHLDPYKDHYANWRERGCRAPMRGYIVGKGPSLDNIETTLVPFQMEGGVVFCLNESIHKIESLGMDLAFETPLYCVQQDSELECACVPHHETTTHFQNSWMHSPRRHWKAIEIVSPWNPKAVLYRYPEWHLSAVAALDIMHLMGLREVTLVCFDGLLRDGPMTYAQCIPHRDSIHKINGIGKHGDNGRATIQKARDLGMKLKTLHPHIPEVEF